MVVAERYVVIRMVCGCVRTVYGDRTVCGCGRTVCGYCQRYVVSEGYVVVRRVCGCVSRVWLCQQGMLCSAVGGCVKRVCGYAITNYMWLCQRYVVRGLFGCVTGACSYGRPLGVVVVEHRV